MKKVVIHAGPHKTGSTYIQKLLHQNRQRLLEQGVAYPEAYYLYFGHHFLLNEIKQPGDNAQSIRDTLVSACQGAELCVLSSENFRSFNQADLDKLRQVLTGVEVEFVFFLRSPSLRLLSLWHETIKHGEFLSVSDYFLQHLLKPMASEEVNLFLYVDALIKAFGRKAVKLVDYDSCARHNGLMKAFFTAASLECLIDDKPMRVNEMLKLTEVEMIRYFNFRANADGILKKSNVREAYMQIRDSLAELISQVDKMIQPYMQPVQLGNTNADNMMFSLLRDRYSDLLVNEMALPAVKQVTLPDNSWGFDRKLTQLLDEVYEQTIKSECVKVQSAEWS